MGRKKKWSARPYESIGETFIDSNGYKKSDTCAQIYESMLTSAAFMGLKPRQKVLYLYCKAQLYGKRKPCKDYAPENYPEFQSESCFYMNWGAVKNYGLYSQNGQHEFYADMKALQERGFIETVMSGKANKCKSIYKYSGQWKYWSEG